ncbi:MAG TPA: ELWxxDGT repeat protein, partial [Flavipsychrobacter sp.]|nr:ELWxxDGT repeat protein [Flavipsychrobacter sp.]
YLYAYGGNIYFATSDGVTGRELWISDGTTAGTSLLKDINTSSAASGPDRFVAFANKVYFSAYDGVSDGLYCTDGTTAGTTLVATVNIGGCISGTVQNIYGIYNGILYFQGSDVSTGCELWVSDGTSSGTMMLKDINAGSGSSVPFGFLEYNGQLYFRASDGAAGYEMWVTDGTAAGTVLFKDFNPGSGDGLPYYHVIYHGKMYFIADDGSNGFHLWESDGTLANTVIRAPSISPLPDPLSSAIPTVHDTSLFFQAEYRSDYGNELYSFSTPDPASVNNTTKVQESVDVYPNPVQGTLNIALPGKGYSLSLYNSIGMLLEERTALKEHDIVDMSLYGGGVYMLNIRDGEGRLQVQKVLKY